MNLGDGEYPVSKVLPSINSGNIGIVVVSGGKFNYYDGIITSVTKAIEGEISSTPELYSVKYNDATQTIAYLEIAATVEQIAKVGTLYYDTLQGAISAIESSGGTGVIEISKDIVLLTTLEIPNETNVTIDLQGYSIRHASEDGTTAVIENNGTLTIIDSLADDISAGYSVIQNLNGVAIQNNSILNIGDDVEATVNINTPRIIGSTYSIQNGEGIGNEQTARLNLYDGILEGITAAINGTITSITSQAGYEVKDGTEVIGEGELTETYITKYLGL